MNTSYFYIFSFSIFLAAFIGIWKIKRIDPVYYPFVICICIGALNEVVSLIFSRLGITTAINNNIYILIESVLLMWLFYEWGLFAQRKGIYYGLVSGLLVLWLICNFWIAGIGTIDLLFRISYSLLIVLMSILMINILIYDYHENLLKNPVFIICIGFVLFYTYKIIFEISWMFGNKLSRDFRISIFELLCIINLIVNLLFSIAILCIPKKPEYLKIS